MAGNLPQDSGPGDVPVAPLSDEQSAANAIAGLLDVKDGADVGGEESGVDETPDTGTEETPSTGDDEEGPSETPADKPASIAAPNSWPAEEKALFAKLPPDLQAVVARREGERDKALLQRGEEIANERKGWDSERQAIATQRDQYAQSLNQVARLMIPEVQALENIDWVQLSRDNPAEYVRLSGMRDNLRGRIGALQQEIGRITQQQQNEQQQARDRRMAEEKQLLIAKVPDLGDAQKGPKLSAELHQNLITHYGFSTDEIGNVLDHRLFTMAVDAMKYRQGEAARASATTKKANPPPTLQRTGNAPTTDGRGRRIAEKVRNLGRTNSVQDAASLLEELL